MRQSNFFKFILHEDDVKINGKDPEEAIKDKQRGVDTPPDANTPPTDQPPTTNAPTPTPDANTAPPAPDTNTPAATPDQPPTTDAPTPTPDAGTDDVPDFTADDEPTGGDTGTDANPDDTPDFTADDEPAAGTDTPTTGGDIPAGGDAVPDAGGDEGDTPDFTADDGGGEGDAGGADGEDTDFTADDAGEDGGDNPDAGAADQNGDAAQGDDGASAVPGGSAIDDEIKQAQQDVFSNLGPDQIAIKNKELKEQFITLYTDINEVIDRITVINRKSDNIAVIEFVTKKFIELRDLVKDDLLFTFDGKSYVQNQIDIHKFLSIYEALTRIIESLGKQKDDEKK